MAESLCFVKLLQILIPFHGQQLFFGIVAFFAARDHVPPGALPSAGDGHDVIHGQLPGRGGSSAVTANPFCQAALPPLRFAQLPGFAAFPLQIVCIQVVSKRLYGLFSFHFKFNGSVKWPTSALRWNFATIAAYSQHASCHKIRTP